MEHRFTQIAAFYARLNNFRETKTFTDLTIKCGDEEFPCHKVVLAAASDYFRTVLGLVDPFLDTKHDRVVELEMTLATLKEVLRFAYTGKALITNQNFKNVHEAGRFLQMRGLINQCLQFWMHEQDKVSQENALNLFCTACAINKNCCLMEKLGDFIVRHLDLLYTTNEFVKVPNKALKILLSRWSSIQSEEVLVKALLQWLQHPDDKRPEYFFNECIGILPPATKNFFKEDMIKNYTSLSKLVESMKCHDEPYNVLNRNGTSLYVYGYDAETMTLAPYSINSAGDCSVLNKIPMLFSPQNMKCVASNESALYCYNYAMYPQFDYTIHVRPLFRRFTSADMQNQLDLKALPLLFANAEMCNVQNNIYLFDAWAYKEGFDQMKMVWPNLTRMNAEELRRGIYQYNTQVDNWFAVPKPLTLTGNAGMTSCDDVLYLIGGSANYRYADPNSSWCAQAYDHRTGTWLQLPNRQYADSNLEYWPTCCAMNGKIYVINSAGKQAERYDPVAGRWELIKSLNEEAAQIVPYADKLWAIRAASILDLQVYSPETNEWYYSLKLHQTASIENPCTLFLGSVVFKSM